MIARSPAPVRALYRQLPDGRFLLRFSDHPQLYEGAPGEKLDTLAERVLSKRPELKARPLPFASDATLRGGGLPRDA